MSHGRKDGWAWLPDWVGKSAVYACLVGWSAWLGRAMDLQSKEFSRFRANAKRRAYVGYWRG